ncbi:hypothetical protein NKJ26_32630 [Mesorhizobium sp. M0152]|uniref:hypothetical protein n=1 Tax=Mesorhizobium sp. M0152 TaxID=2956898 RepID=UPI00333CAB84
MIQLAWRFLLFQKDSALARWFQARTADGRMAAPHVRGDNQGEVRQAKLASSSRCESGPGKE